MKNNEDSMLKKLNFITSCISLICSICSVIFIMIDEEKFIYNKYYIIVLFAFGLIMTFLTILSLWKKIYRQRKDLNFCLKNLNLALNMYIDKKQVFIINYSYDSELTCKLKLELEKETSRYTFNLISDNCNKSDIFKNKIEEYIIRSDYCVMIISKHSDFDKVNQSILTIKKYNKEVLPIILESELYNQYSKLFEEETHIELSSKEDSKNNSYVYLTAQKIIKYLDTKALNSNYIISAN